MPLVAVWLVGCAEAVLAPLAPGAHAVYAFDVETYLGRRYAGYASTLEGCSGLRQVELANQTSTAPHRFPFYRTTVLSICYPAALAEDGYAWAVEVDGTWGAVMPSAGLCDAMRETLVPSVAPQRLAACRPVTLTRRVLP